MYNIIVIIIIIIIIISPVLLLHVCMYVCMYVHTSGMRRQHGVDDWPLLDQHCAIVKDEMLRWPLPDETQRDGGPLWWWLGVCSWSMMIRCRDIHSYRVVGSNRCDWLLLDQHGHCQRWLVLHETHSCRGMVDPLMMTDYLGLCYKYVNVRT